MNYRNKLQSVLERITGRGDVPVDMDIETIVNFTDVYTTYKAENIPRRASELVDRDVLIEEVKALNREITIINDVYEEDQTTVQSRLMVLEDGELAVRLFNTMDYTVVARYGGTRSMSLKYSQVTDSGEIGEVSVDDIEGIVSYVGYCGGPIRVSHILKDAIDGK